LYNTIVLQKQNQKKSYSYETNYLGPSQIRCPYCRTIHTGLLPYIPLKNICPIPFVNFPIKFVMNYNKFCGWKFINGKHKNNLCNKHAHYDINNNLDINSLSQEDINKLPVFCVHHWTTYNNQAIKIKNKIIQVNQPIILSEEMIKLSKEYTITTLKKLLKDNNLKQSGNKNELVKRYVDFINQKD
jgi:hypothetical protein